MAPRVEALNFLCIDFMSMRKKKFNFLILGDKCAIFYVRVSVSNKQKKIRQVISVIRLKFLTWKLFRKKRVFIVAEIKYFKFLFLLHRYNIFFCRSCIMPPKPIAKAFVPLSQFFFSLQQFSNTAIASSINSKKKVLFLLYLFRISCCRLLLLSWEISITNKHVEKLDVKQFPYVQFILNQTLISFDINFLYVFLVPLLFFCVSFK